ncbi:PREDICTED: 28S ribosomal protein S34, mitochondrial, partial [Acanthisitta chloris]|uniref:28S ribosomal protein S34, mitochondrial n=1 Tax=Acanthisitta chloris TaxID=57068 RepID=UPI0004F0CD7B
LNRCLFSLQNMDHGRAWGYLTFRGKTEEEEREIEKAMYHDWRMVPKHEEENFKKFTPVQVETVRFLPYPPLLRAMILAQWQKEGKPITEEPMIDVEKVLATPRKHGKRRATGTPV